ncbi:MAG: hypothetical protein Q8942_13040 [Bacillota bacterium]|nr:hypothetical protein [Bacillota bacterium]
MVGAVYVTIRNILIGNFTLLPVKGGDRLEKKIVFFVIISIVVGAIAGIGVGVRNYLFYHFNIVLIPIMRFMSPFMFVCMVFLDRAAIKRADKIANDN